MRQPLCTSIHHISPITRFNLRVTPHHPVHELQTGKMYPLNIIHPLALTRHNSSVTLHRPLHLPHYKALQLTVQISHPLTRTHYNSSVTCRRPLHVSSPVTPHGQLQLKPRYPLTVTFYSFVTYLTHTLVTCPMLFTVANSYISTTRYISRPLQPIRCISPTVTSPKLQTVTIHGLHISHPLHIATCCMSNRPFHVTACYIPNVAHRYISHITFPSPLHISRTRHISLVTNQHPHHLTALYGSPPDTFRTLQPATFHPLYLFHS